MNLKRIGVIATSAPGTKLSIKSKERGLKFFSEKEIELAFGENVFSSTDYVAGSSVERMSELIRMMHDTTIDIIISFWGGHQTHELLPLIFNDIISLEKPIIGYSDLTPLLNYLASRGYKQAHLGPAFITHCKPVRFSYSWDYFIASLSGESFLVEPSQEFTSNLWLKDGEMKIKQSNGWNSYKEGVASGPAMGGNMGALLLTAGTPYWPNLEDCILFLEEDESESIETIDRFLTQLSQMGVFHQVKGVVIGRFTENVFETENDLRRLIDKIFKDFNGPVLFNADFGHSDPLFTIPLGRTTTLNSSHQKSSIRFESVR